MRIVDTKLNVVGLGSDSNKETIGIVFKTSKDLNNRPLLGLIIPKFMIGYEFKDGQKASDISVPITGSKCVNETTTSKFWSSSVIIKNYILVRPYLNQNQSMPNYVVGDKVIVTIIDNDIKTLAFLPYTINRLGQRSTDKCMFSVPANPKENTALSEDNTYFIKLDSDSKVIILSTSKKNGETCAQVIGMDAENGQIAISDNEDRSWILDTKNDSITSKTSGTTIEQTGNVINIKADTINIEGETAINIKTSKLVEESDTTEAKSSNVTYEFDNFKQSSNSGKYEIQQEEHSGMSMSIKESTYHNNTPLIGLNGQVVFPNFVIGAIPNINAPVPPVNGMSGPSGAMLLQTDPAGMPLAKFPQLVPPLIDMSTKIDTLCAILGIPPSAVSAVQVFVASGMTTKLLSS